MRVHVEMVLDMSGSMESCREATISGVNEYAETLKRDTASDYTLALTPFNTETMTRMVRPLKDFKPLTPETYKPDACTPLYDAVGLALKGAETESAGAQKKLCVIVTDGLENSSKEWTVQGIRQRIKDLEGQGWTFIYLGANQDAWAVGTPMGIAGANTMSYKSTPSGMASTMAHLSRGTTMYAQSAKPQTQSFFADAGQTVRDYQDPRDQGVAPAPPAESPREEDKWFQKDTIR